MSHEAFDLNSIGKSLLFFDDFEGDSLKDEWLLTVVGTGAGAVVGGLDGGVYRLRAPTNATADSAQINWNDLRTLTVAKKVVMEVRARVSHLTYVDPWFYMYYDGNNYIMFYADETVGGATNWRIITISAGVPTNLDSGVALDTSWHIFRIEAHTHGGNHVHFYIDGVETANSPISTNVPTSYLQPQLYVRTRTAAERQLDIDYVIVKQDR